LLKLSPEFEVKFDFGDEGKDGEGETAPDFTGKEPVGKCPKCGGRVFENGMNYVCESSVGAAKKCDFRTGTVILQQAIDRIQAGKLLADGKTDLLKEFVSKKTGRKFEAFLTLKEGKVSFEFAPREKKFPSKDRKAAEPEPLVDFTGQEPVGACPKCKGHVYEHGANYVCEHSVGAHVTCDFKSGKIILQQAVSHEEFTKLLATGKTSLLQGFVSNKTRRAFKAYLAWDPKEGKVSFEFEPRPERKPAAGAAGDRTDFFPRGGGDLRVDGTRGQLTNWGYADGMHLGRFSITGRSMAYNSHSAPGSWG
jgi:DNA topoisomerase-3